MDLNYIYDLSIEKKSQVNDNLRKLVLICNIIKEVSALKKETRKEEKKWLDTCLNKLNQLKL